MKFPHHHELESWFTPEEREALGLSETNLPDTKASFQKIETLFSQVRLPVDVVPLTNLGPLELAGFESVRKLGEGSFGEVFLARDLNLGRDVAIKRIRFDVTVMGGDEVSVLREARLASRLNHPGIVTLYDAVEQDGHFYLISEFVEGGTLATQLRGERKLEPDRAAAIAHQIALAMTHAHQKGIVHRDLKPANILLTPDEVARVGDFGLAIHDEGQTALLAQSSGTLEYMSPEQLPGKHEYVDGRADIWGLGVMLYRMLTGKQPFGGDTAEELISEIERRDPKPPSQIVPGIPAELQRICLRCLAKARDNRYASASELSTDLEQFLLRRKSAGRRWAWTWAAAALLLGLGWSTWALLAPADSGTPIQRELNRNIATTRIEVLRADVRHFRYDDQDRGQDLGSLGRTTSQARVRDELRIELEFDRPAYVYLIELTTQGEVVSHFPAVNARELEPQSVFAYPADPLETIWLDDGPGQCVFVMAASAEPLPKLDDWLREIGGLPWEATTADGVWRYRRRGIQPGHFLRERGSRRVHEQPPDAFSNVCRYLEVHADELTLYAVAFPIVEPGDQHASDRE